MKDDSSAQSRWGTKQAYASSEAKEDCAFGGPKPTVRVAVAGEALGLFDAVEAGSGLRGGGEALLGRVGKNSNHGSGSIMRRLESDLGELKSLSTSVLGPLGRQQALTSLGGGRAAEPLPHHSPPPYAGDLSHELVDPEIEAAAAYLKGRGGRPGY